MEKNNKLSKAAAQEKQLLFAMQEVTEHHQGPLPHPDMLLKYEQIYKGAAKIIFDGMEKEQKHRHAWENKAIELEKIALENAYREAKLGKSLSSALGGLLICGAIFSIYIGSEIGAGIFLSITCLGYLKKIASSYFKKK